MLKTSLPSGFRQQASAAIASDRKPVSALGKNRNAVIRSKLRPQSGELLRVMNQRIEVLLGRDYCLGHAYFMELQHVSDDEALARLALIFRQKVLPLLQEYFFEDWERIGWVLNDQSADSNGTQPFIRQPVEAEGKSLQALFGSKVAGGLSERRWELNDEAFVSIDSYRNICGSAG